MRGPATLTVLLVTDGPARLSGPVLAERFAGVRCEVGSVLAATAASASPEAVLAYCRARRIGLRGSAVVARRVVQP